MPRAFRSVGAPSCPVRSKDRRIQVEFPALLRSLACSWVFPWCPSFEIVVRMATDLTHSPLRSRRGASRPARQWRQYPPRAWLCGLMLAASPAVLAQAAETDVETARDALDWVPEEALSDAQRQALPTACCGIYVAPEETHPEAGEAPESSPIRVSADRSTSTSQTRHALEGDVEILQGSRSLRAERVELDQDGQRGNASGDIRIREPGLLLRGESATMKMDSGDMTLDDARFVLYETRIRGEADRLEKLGDRFIGLERGSLTTCEPDSDAWQFKGQDINIYPEKHYGTARHARMEVFNVPVFYTPYLRFPVGDQRQTGFLYPSFGHSSRNGIEASVPFYWNIAPNMDATITPEYMQERGTLWNLEWRHLSRYFETQVAGGYLDEDRGRGDGRQRDVTGEPTEPGNPHFGEERWQLQVQQEGGRNQRWSTEIDYTDLSDNDYLRDFNSNGLDVNRTAQVAKRGRVSYQADHWLLSAKAEELRALSTGRWPHRELPRINADGQYRWGDWVLGLRNEYVYFDVNSTFEASNPDAVATLPTGERFRTDYSLTWDKEWLWGFFKPSARVKSLSYRLNEDNVLPDANAEPSLVVPQGTLDMGLYFERDSSLFGRGFLQTLEPRVFYFYSQYEDHSDLFGVTAANRPLLFDSKPLTFQYNQLYRTTRYSGGDRIEDANQVSLGLTSRLIDPLTGVEHLNVGIGQIFYFEDRRVTLTSPDFQYDPSADPDAERPEETYSRSELAGQFSARLNDRWNINGNVAYNQYENRLGSANASIRYHDESDRIVNLGYRYTHRPPAPGFEDPTDFEERALDQVDLSFYLPVAGQWGVIGRANYDLTYEKELDTFIGLEYDDCCYRVRIMARRWLDFDYTPDFLSRVTREDYDESIIFDIQFKGLGSINRSVGELLEKVIPGYNAGGGFLR